MLRNSYKVTEPLSRGDYQDSNPSLNVLLPLGFKGDSRATLNLAQSPPLLNVVLVCQSKGIALPEHKRGGCILQIK